MASLDTLTGMALGLRDRSIDDVERVFAEYLAQDGWEEPPPEYDWEGDYLRGTLLDYGDHGVWIYIEELAEPRPEIARGFAQSIDDDVEVRQLTVRERRNGTFAIRSGTKVYGPDGSSRDLDIQLPDDNPELEEGAGDLYETSATFLGLLVHENRHQPTDKPRTLVRYRPEVEEEDDGIDPRLKKLAGEITDAGKWEIIDMMGQQMLRVELPDGTRQMSRVTDEELEWLRETTAIEPG